MIPPLPHDKALTGLWALLDETTMATMITSQLNAKAECEAIEITACRPRYVRYKPETSCLLQYDLSLRSGNHQVDLSAHIRLFVDDRARTRASSARLRRHQERVSQEQTEFALRRVARLPEVNGLLEIYPLDYDLRHLERASDPTYVSGMLRKGLPEFQDLVVVGEPELVRYKPERKALLRYQLRHGPVEAVYGKVHVDDRSELLGVQTLALIEAGVSTPPVLVTVPKRHFVAHGEAAGGQLASLRGSDAYDQWMEPLANALRHLQSVEPSGLRKHRLGDQAALIRRAAAWLGIVAPHLSERLVRVGDDIALGLTSVDERLATSHGDFYDDQALVSDDGLTIIDFDELRRGHPLLDVGNMLAHLAVGEERGQDVGAAREQFRVEALRHLPYTEAEVALFEASALLRLAPGPFRRLEPDWPEGIERILALAEVSLEKASRSVSRRSGSPPISDYDLPQLATLQDTTAMAANLTVALNGSNRAGDGRTDHGRLISPAMQIEGHSVGRRGRPGESLRRREQTRPPAGTAPAGKPAVLHQIEVVRHKPGRRAILRYDLESGERFFGKTFASKRGPKVYEIARIIAASNAFGPDVSLPDPVAWLPDLKLLLQRPVAGLPIEGALLSGDQDVATEVAIALHRFHTSGLDLGCAHNLVRELEPLPMRAAQVAETCPDLGEAAKSCLQRIQEVDASQVAWRSWPVHRDFYHDQVLIDGDALAILDLDDATMSEPLVDVANFRAHLMLLGAQRRGDVAACAAVGDVFVNQYRQLAPDLDEQLLDFLTATTLLRLSGIHASRTDGSNVARLLIEAATSSLSTYGPHLVLGVSPA